MNEVESKIKTKDRNRIKVTCFAAFERTDSNQPMVTLMTDEI